MQRLSNKAIITTAFGRVFSFIIIIITLGVYIGHLEGEMSEEILSTGWLLVILIVLVLLFILYSVLWVKLFRYEVAPGEFKKEYGVISKSYVSIPYQRIQNVNIRRGLLERMLGISSLKIETAGSELARAEGRIPGIDQQIAEEVREEILSKSRADRQGNQADSDIPQPGV